MPRDSLWLLRPPVFISGLLVFQGDAVAQWEVWRVKKLNIKEGGGHADAAGVENSRGVVRPAYGRRHVSVNWMRGRGTCRGGGK